MEGELKLNKELESSMHDGAVNDLHELELSAEGNISEADFEAFQSLVGHIRERENEKKIAHLSSVNPNHLGKLEALMYRWARTIQAGTDEFEKFTKEKEMIESLLRESKGVPSVYSRLAFYEFLTNLIEAPIEKRVP